MGKGETRAERTRCTLQRKVQSGCCESGEYLLSLSGCACGRNTRQKERREREREGRGEVVGMGCEAALAVLHESMMPPPSHSLHPMKQGKPIVSLVRRREVLLLLLLASSLLPKTRPKQRRVCRLSFYISFSLFFALHRDTPWALETWQKKERENRTDIVKRKRNPFWCYRSRERDAHTDTHTERERGRDKQRE